MTTETTGRPFLLTLTAGAAALTSSRLAHADESDWQMVRQPFPFGDERVPKRDDACLAAVATAVDFHVSIGPACIEARMNELATALKEGLTANGVPLETPMAPSVSAGVTTVSVAPEKRRSLVFELDRLGVAGSPAGGLRLCPHIYNTMEHVDRAVRAVSSLRSRIAGGLGP